MDVNIVLELNKFALVTDMKRCSVNNVSNKQNSSTFYDNGFETIAVKLKF